MFIGELKNHQQTSADNFFSVTMSCISLLSHGSKSKGREPDILRRHFKKLSKTVFSISEIKRIKPVNKEMAENNNIYKHSVLGKMSNFY